LLVYNLA